MASWKALGAIASGVSQGLSNNAEIGLRRRALDMEDKRWGDTTARQEKLDRDALVNSELQREMMRLDMAVKAQQMTHAQALQRFQLRAAELGVDLGALNVDKARREETRAASPEAAEAWKADIAANIAQNQLAAGQARAGQGALPDATALAHEKLRAERNKLAAQERDRVGLDWLSKNNTLQAYREALTDNQLELSPDALDKATKDMQALSAPAWLDALTAAEGGNLDEAARLVFEITGKAVGRTRDGALQIAAREDGGWSFTTAERSEEAPYGREVVISGDKITAFKKAAGLVPSSEQLRQTEQERLGVKTEREHEAAFAKVNALIASGNRQAIMAMQQQAYEAVQQLREDLAKERARDRTPGDRRREPVTQAAKDLKADLDTAMEAYERLTRALGQTIQDPQLRSAALPPPDGAEPRPRGSIPADDIDALLLE